MTPPEDCHGVVDVCGVVILDPPWSACSGVWDFVSFAAM